VYFSASACTCHFKYCVFLQCVYMLRLVYHIISSKFIIVCCYSWQYCINKVHDYPNTGLVAAVAHDYAKNHFHPQYKRRVRDLWDTFQFCWSVFKLEILLHRIN
jgi:hypothetical protein